MTKSAISLILELPTSNMYSTIIHLLQLKRYLIKYYCGIYPNIFIKELPIVLLLSYSVLQPIFTFLFIHLTINFCNYKNNYFDWFGNASINITSKPNLSFPEYRFTSALRSYEIHRSVRQRENHESMPNVCEIEDMHVHTLALGLFPGGIVRRLSWRKFIYSRRGIFNSEAWLDARFCETLDLRRVEFSQCRRPAVQMLFRMSVFIVYTLLFL